VPPILDLKMLDRRIMIGAEESFRRTAEVLKREGVFAGVSSGAVLAAAIKVAERLEEGNIVALFADGGWKYLSTGLWTQRYDDLKGAVEGKIWW
jgi:cysteine synthase